MMMMMMMMMMTTTMAQRNSPSSLLGHAVHGCPRGFFRRDKVHRP